jgi:hypothetical protein
MTPIITIKPLAYIEMRAPLRNCRWEPYRTIHIAAALITQTLAYLDRQNLELYDPNRGVTVTFSI